MPTFQQPVEPIGGVTGPHLLENFLSAEQAPEFANALWYHPLARVWIAGGRGSGLVRPIAFYTLGGATVPRWRQRSANSGIDSEFICKSFDFKAHTYLGVGGIRMSGVLNTGSTATKVYYSSDLGINWTGISVGASSTLSADNVDYELTIGSLVTLSNTVFRASTYNGAHSSVLTMSGVIPHRGLTIRPASGDRVAMAVVIDDTTTARYSTNGTSWSSNTLPSACSVIEWSQHRKTFVTITSAGAIYENPDLSTGSWTLTNAGPFLTVGLFGNYLVAVQAEAGSNTMRKFVYSLDGTNWSPMFYTFANAGTLTFNEIVAAYRPKAEYPHQLGIAMTGVNNPTTHILTTSG